MPRLLCLACCLALLLSSMPASGQNPPAASAPQQPAAAEPVRAIEPPRNPLPPESASAQVTRFSFIVYGDTRGRRDGREPQYEHSLIVNSAVERIKRLEQTPYPVRFVLQTGDGVENGRIVRQWNVSFVDLINRLTQEGGVPYFLAPGNHDVTSAGLHTAPERQIGLRNFFAVNANLIPPEGSPRRLSGYPTFAFGYGNTFVIAIDSNIAADDTQYEWVKGQLEGLDRQRYRHILVYCHHPAFSSGPHGGARIEAPTAAIRARYLPLFRQHRVRVFFSGHEHLFEHWVERYEDSAGRQYRLDHVLTGGGGAPIYAYRGDPNTIEYTKANEAEKVTLERLVKPGFEPGDNPYHYVLVQVDGEELRLEVIGVDWGRNFQPYRSNRADLQDPKPGSEPPRP
jgi:hypothetical protein